MSLEERAAIHAALAEPARLAVVDALVLGDASPGELGQALGLPSNLLAHHLKVLTEAGLVQRARSEADRRRTYVRLVPAALAGLNSAVSVLTRAAARVVFVCTHNSARSQLAAALWNQHGRRPYATVPAASAGTDPSPRVHRRAGCTSDTLTANAYQELLQQAGFAAITITPTSCADDGLRSAIIQATKPGIPAPGDSAPDPQ
ncbi:helix-turn-helix domain-containing protein [Actinomadura alba]|nr:helix-turn-helix domain-containing protein [Actinomadura alba]